MDQITSLTGHGQKLYFTSKPNQSEVLFYRSWSEVLFYFQVQPEAIVQHCLRYGEHTSDANRQGVYTQKTSAPMDELVDI